MDHQLLSTIGDPVQHINKKLARIPHLEHDVEDLAIDFPGRATENIKACIHELNVTERARAHTCMHGRTQAGSLCRTKKTYISSLVRLSTAVRSIVAISIKHSTRILPTRILSNCVYTDVHSSLSSYILVLGSMSRSTGWVGQLENSCRA